MASPPTIRGLAKQLGCSAATVSLALRGSAQISPETRERVVAMATKMGYKANRLVAELMGERRKTNSRSARNAAPPNLRAVAAHAGCGVSTAALAFRNPSRVSEELRGKILAVAANLGYQQYPAETSRVVQRRRQVRLHCSTTLAFVNIFPDLEIWNSLLSHIRFVSGAAERAAQIGCKLETFHLDGRRMTGKRLSGILQARGIQGVILGSAPAPAAHVRMDWPSFSAVSQGFTVIFPNISRVAADYPQCLRVALREARRLGYRRVGLHVLSEIDLRCQQLWTGTFLAAQLLIPEEDRVPICPLEKRGKAAFKAWVTAHRPEVILTFTGTTLLWLEEMNLRVPDDVGLINLSRHREEPRPERDPCNWAGVEHPMEEVGAAATDLVLAQLIANERGLSACPRSVTLPGRWLDGWTVKDHKRVVPITRGLKRRSSHGRYPDGS